MSIAFTCPNCDRQYRVKDQLRGKTVSCKNCKHKITIGANNAGENEFFDFVDDVVAEEFAKVASRSANRQHRQQRRQTAIHTSIFDDPSLRRVATGLTVLLGAVVVSAVCLLYFALALGGILRTPSPFSAPPEFVLATIVLIAAGIATLAGECICLSVPEQSGARSPLSGAVVLHIAALFVGLIGFLLPRLPFINVLSSLCSLITTILFVSFMKRLAEYIKCRSAQENAQRLLYVIGLAFVVPVLFIVGSLILVMFGPLLSMAMPMLMSISMLVLLLIGIVLYVRTITQLRMAILNPSTVVDNNAATQAL